MHTKRNSFSSAFTLIEVLVVIALIAVLALIVYSPLNPLRRFQDANDSRRTTDVNSLLTAIHQYIVDNKGSLPTGLTAGMSETQLGTGISGCDISSGGCNVVSAACVDLTTPLTKYIKSLPIDPSSSATYSSLRTGYSVVVDTNGIVTVKACGTEGSTPISASR